MSLVDLIFGREKKMSIELQTKYGQIDISNDVIATVAGSGCGLLRNYRNGFQKTI